MRIALTANGPGEFAGWLRPLAHALYARDPEVDVTVFCLPDDYATGGEARYVRELFPRATVHEPAEASGLAFGRSAARAPARFDRVQYLGGDLMYAAALAQRCGGRLTTYKFARRRDLARLQRAFAVDERNRDALVADGIPGDRISVVGNLVIDGALDEARAPLGDDPLPAQRDGIIFFPGTRKHEVANLYPFFVAAALHVRRLLPGVPIAFARSPFTSDEELSDALRAGGIPQVYGTTGRLVTDGSKRYIESAGVLFALEPAAMRAAARARLAVAIPGTKLIELAALGVPTVVTTLFNAPELAVINGPLQYLDRVPIVGLGLKRNAALAFAKRFRWFGQPNTDAQETLLPELRGTLFPARVAQVAVERYLDLEWCKRTGERLREMYAPHAGAAARMATFLVETRAPVSSEAGS